MCIRVLLADPDEDLLQILDELLSLDKFKVATATTGPQCIALLRKFQPDVLVLELDLPGGWSDRILTIMRIGLEIACVPTVILSRCISKRTNYVDSPIVKQFHVKPTSIAQLKESIRSAV